MQGIVADLESGRLNVRYPGREDTRYVKPEISAVMVDVCLERFLEKADLDEVLDFDSFTACNEPLFISMRTLAQFASAKRNKLGGNPHAITVAYAHVLAGQWVVSHSWREDKLFFANQPKVFQAIFAPDDLAWKEGSGIDEAHGRTLRVLFQVYRQVQTFKISMILAQAGMPSGLLSILNDRDLTVGYVVRRVREDQTIDLSQGLTGRLFDTAYATPNFGKFMESLQSGVGEEDTLFARTLSEVKTEWNLTVPAEEE